MKSLTLKLLVPALFVASCAHLQARFVTLNINNQVSIGPIKLLAELTILSNEVATVRSTIGYSIYMNIIKDGVSFGYASGIGAYTVAGPALF